MYTVNYPGSPSGYDPNVPYGRNHWDEEEEETISPSESIREDEEEEYPRSLSLVVDNRNGNFNTSISNSD